MMVLHHGSEGVLTENRSGASAVTQDDWNIVLAIDNLKRAPDPVGPSTTPRGAVGRRQMRTFINVMRQLDFGNCAEKTRIAL
jgi:hypothetical protein